MSSYILYHFTRFQDGHEEGVSLHSSIQQALDTITRYESGSSIKDPTTYKLFELGKEIPIQMVETEVPQPPIKTVKCVLKKGKQ